MEDTLSSSFSSVVSSLISVCVLYLLDGCQFSISGVIFTNCPSLRFSLFKLIHRSFLGNLGCLDNSSFLSITVFSGGLGVSGISSFAISSNFTVSGLGLSKESCFSDTVVNVRSRGSVLVGESGSTDSSDILRSSGPGLLVESFSSYSTRLISTADPALALGGCFKEELLWPMPMPESSTSS